MNYIVSKEYLCRLCRAAANAGVDLGQAGGAYVNDEAIESCVTASIRLAQSVGLYCKEVTSHEKGNK